MSPGADGAAAFFCTLDEAFAKIAADFAERPALADATTELSYAELDAAVEAAAAVLTACGARTGSLVAVRLTPSAELIVVLLAVLRSGGCYLSLDPSMPARRAELILADARPCALVEAFEGEPGAGWKALTATSAACALTYDGPPVLLGDPDDPCAYVIYTSGTTGVPKGVPVTHRNVAALFAATAEKFDFTENDRWLLFHSTAFDFSVWEIWGALLHGGRLFVPDQWTVLDPHTVARVVRDERITVLNQTPTAFSALAPELIGSAAEVRLRYVIFGGERLRPSSLLRWTETVGYERVTLVNMYGITEITVHATYHRVVESDVLGGESVIGHPLPGFTAAVVDEDGNPANRGELLLAGEQVVGGYLNRPALTAEQFRSVVDGGPVFYRSGDVVERGADGELRYVGRIDDQVKIRGHRIELGEVEAALSTVPGVVSVCAFPVQLPGADVLACCYTTADGQPLPGRVIRAQLRSQISDYMIPAKLHWAAELPRNHNGKVDRVALRDSLQGTSLQGTSQSSL